MTIEIDDNERAVLLVSLGMAAAVAMQHGHAGVFHGIQLLLGKIAPESYWALKPEDKEYVAP